MREEGNYWTRRLRAGTLSRRRFVGGAAAASVGAAAFGLVGCGDDDDDDDGNGGATTTATSAGGSTATASATGTTGAATPQKGGTAHLVSANNTWDTFDVDRSRFSPVAWLFGYTNLGVVQWKSFVNPEIEGGLAESWQNPDETTTVFKLRPNVFWHDKAPVNGRAATAEDIAYAIERNKAGVLLDGTDDPNFYRQALYASVEKVEVTDPTTVTVTHNRPDPFFVNTLAGSYSKVQAREAIEQFEGEYQNLRAELVIGTGAFVLDQFAAEGQSHWSAHPKFHEQVNFDGIQWYPLFTDQTAQEVAFRQREIDAFAPTQNSTIDQLNSDLKGQITEARYFAGNPQAGTYYGGAAPWNNKNLMGGLFKALDRRALVAGVLQGKGAMSGNVPPPQAAFTINEQELQDFEGYRTDRAKEEQEARQMWEAGGGPALGEIIVDIPDIWEQLYSGGAASITSQLNKVLGNTFTAKVEPYSTITGKIVNKEYGNGKNNIWYGWITEIADIEPTVLNFLTYNSSSDQWPQFSVKSDKIDELTGKSMVEFDLETRKEISKDVVRECLREWGAGVPYTMNGITTLMSWNYFHIPESSSFVQTHMYGTKYWFDQNDPTWQGRKA
ncbi:MAG: ABC transporter substrate-binding protein [Dehalococcoidia bacterium]|nr:ABC transporter substrate-binding protein [Dehalococcoidia bacterium]